MVPLFMNKMQVSVPENSVLAFHYDSDDPAVCKVRFHIGGVWFETTENIVMSFPDSFFATFLTTPMDSASSDTPELKQRKISSSDFRAELFPLVFDFMRRHFHESCCVLRTVALNKVQSLELDRIEQFFFPEAEAVGLALPVRVTGPKFALNPASGRAQVALLPAYSNDGGGNGFMFHEYKEICKDSRFVSLVKDCQENRKRKRYTVDEEMVSKLIDDYELPPTTRITVDVLKNCSIYEIDRGDPFVILPDEEAGTHYLRVVTESDEMLGWNVA